MRKRADTLEKKIIANRRNAAKHVVSSVRAGYYVNWDAASFRSLQDHIDHMNMVLPEWFFLSNTSDSLYVDIDQNALAVMRQPLHKNVAIIPMITNNFGQEWRPETVHKLLSSEASRKSFINQVLALLR